MIVEAVTVCVDYGDMLRQMAPFNRPLLDRWVVVTTPEDEETRQICRDYSIECVLTNDFDRRGEFSKAMGIERGLAHLRGTDWLLHMDADIALPHDFYQVLDDAHLDEDCIYGCDRLNVVGKEAWDRVKGRGLWSRQGVWSIHLNRQDCTLGTRVANIGHGWTPIGFFSLWHYDSHTWRSFPARRYPTHHGTAARNDVQMGLHWDRRQRVLIPELLVWHLETEKAPMGANWRGRKTKRLDGLVLPQQPGGEYK